MSADRPGERPISRQEVASEKLREGDIGRVVRGEVVAQFQHPNDE